MFTTFKTTLVIRIKLGDNHVVCSNTGGQVTLKGIQFFAYYVPEFRVNLLSVSQLDIQGFKTTCEYGHRLIEKANQLLLVAEMKNGLYQVSTTTKRNNLGNLLITTRSMAKNLAVPLPQDILEEESPRNKLIQNTKPKIQNTTGNDITQQIIKHNHKESIELWHKRLAHLNQKTLQCILHITNSDVDLTKCDICIKSKHQQHFERQRVPHSTKPFELIHSDMCGPIGTLSIGGAAYYIVYIDDCTRHTELYFLITKSSSEICVKFKHYMAWVKTQGFTIKRFRCDNGRGEYNNKDFLDILGSNGITYEPAPPYSQHKNGVSERMIRTINTKARSMLLDAALPMRFWAEAIRTSCYLHQRTPSSSLPDGKSPYEMLSGKTPNICHLRRFGCIAYKWIPEKQRTNKKFGARSKLCMMLGYVHNTTKLYRLWDFDQQRAIECSNVRWHENLNAFEFTTSGKHPEHEDPINIPDTTPIYSDSDSELDDPDTSMYDHLEK